MVQNVSQPGLDLSCVEGRCRAEFQGPYRPKESRTPERRW